MRTILVHLNVEVPDDDQRTADEIAEAVSAATHIGMEGGDPDHVGGLTVSAPLAEEI